MDMVLYSMIKKLEERMNENEKEIYFQPLNLINGWEKYSGSFEEAEFIKDSDGIVHIKGLIKNGEESSTIANLPKGFRPSGTNIFIVASGGGKLGLVYISKEGRIIDNSGHSVLYLSLSGISFKAET